LSFSGELYHPKWIIGVITPTVRMNAQIQFVRSERTGDVQRSMSMEKTVSSYPDGCELLHGNLFRIKRTLIRRMSVEDAAAPETDLLTPFNPRTSLALEGFGDVSESKGLSDAEMAELVASVAEHGVMEPMLCRFVNGPDGLQVWLVAGERRLIAVDTLLREDRPCRDPITGEPAIAADVFEYLEARIYHISHV
jgi:hypothetical protein